MKNHIAAVRKGAIAKNRLLLTIHPIIALFMRTKDSIIIASNVENYAAKNA